MVKSLFKNTNIILFGGVSNRSYKFPEDVECYNWALYYVIQGIEEISKHFISGDISSDTSDTRATRDTANRIIKYLDCTYELFGR